MMNILAKRILPFPCFHGRKIGGWGTLCDKIDSNIKYTLLIDRNFEMKNNSELTVNENLWNLRVH